MTFTPPVSPADDINSAIVDALNVPRDEYHNPPTEAGVDLANGQAGDLQWHAGAAPEYVQTQGGDATAKPKDAPQPGVEGVAFDGSGKGADIVKAALTQLGVKYVYGAHQWGQAVDCSGLTQLAAAHAGITVGGNTYSQVQQGIAVPDLAHAQPGDFVFTMGDIGNRVNGHVGIYMGGGKVIAAPHTGSVVQIQDWSGRPITAIRRYV